MDANNGVQKSNKKKTHQDYLTRGHVLCFFGFDQLTVI